MNNEIKAPQVRLIDENGDMVGVLSTREAIEMAEEASLDLIEISPNAVPPVCKIQDYGKYLYEKDKSDRAARKKQKIIVIKEVKFSVNVDEHDYVTKKNQAVRFLTEGDKVKASLRFKGRQMAHRDLGYKIINRLIMDVGVAGVVEFMPRMEGTTLHAIIAPIKKAEVVAEYWGPIITEAELQRRRGKYFFELENQLAIDGKGRKNVARYINHSCSPNCEPQENVKQQRVFIIARRAVKPGEEFGYDYGREYWDEHIKPIGCRCGCGG